MKRARPRWANADIPLALLVVIILALAFVLPTWLSDSEGESSDAPDGAAPSSGPEQRVVPAPTVSADAGGPTGLPSPRGDGICVDVPAPRLTAASFNIHSGLSRDRTRLVLDQIVAEIEALDVDVVLLQEVDRNRLWTGRVDQPGHLAKRLGFYYAFGTNVRRAGNSEYGTAILSRFPIDSARNTPLPNRPGMQQRGLLHVQVSPFGSPISLYVTHLQHTSSAMRLEQARAITRIVGGDPLPTILGGDLNARPSSDVLGALRGPLDDSWAVAGSGPGLTHPAGTPRSRIDYLLYSGGLRPVASVVLPSAVSDHRVVRTVFEVGNATSGVCLPSFGR